MCCAPSSSARAATTSAATAGADAPGRGGYRKPRPPVRAAHQRLRPLLSRSARSPPASFENSTKAKPARWNTCIDGQIKSCRPASPWLGKQTLCRSYGRRCLHNPGPPPCPLPRRADAEPRRVDPRHRSRRLRLFRRRPRRARLATHRHLGTSVAVQRWTL